MSNLRRFREELKERARKALSKPPRYGVDIDILEYGITGLTKMDFDLYSPEVAKKLELVGIDTEEKARSGSYYQVDNIVLQELSKQPGVKVMSLEDAFEEFGDDLLKYYWRVVPVDKDKYTAVAELLGRGGYVIWVKENVKVSYPIQACLIVTSNNILQAPHNIIIAERNSEVHVITGCLVMKENIALHAGISEFYVGENAKVTFTMIHNWNENMHIRPRTGVLVKESGHFISHYINISPVNSLQTYPIIRLVGNNARAHLSSVIIGTKSSKIDIGGEIILDAEKTRGDIISRTIAKDKTEIIARGRLTSTKPRTKGHLECRGLLLSNEASITTIPELKSSIQDTELTHEASIGKLAEEEILYLMARGFSREEAEGLLIRGFMRVDIEGLPRNLMKLIDQTIKLISIKAL